jgi:beta-lactamase regulating signal transducer with metallopeptidase domain
MNQKLFISLAAVVGSVMPLIFDSALKGAVLLVVAALTVLALWRASAATRHLVWLVAVMALLVVPVLAIALPQWRVLPAWAVSPLTAPPEEKSPPVEPTLTGWHGSGPLPISPAPPIDPSVASASPLLPSPVLAKQEPFVEPSVFPAVSESPLEEPASSWHDWLPLAWAAGCGLFALRLLASHLLLRAAARRCAPLTSPPDEAIASAFASACTQLGVRQRVTLLLDKNRTIPVVWGVFRPRLLLPVEARQWNEEQLRSVLLHELAHIKRRDTLVQWFTQIACALHWFNPLVWMAAWRLHVERERACDDLVLASGVRPSTYAEHLLHVASKLSPARWTQACGLAMARKSSLEGRLLAVLSDRLNRRSVTSAIAASALILGATIAVPVAMLRAAEQEWNPPKAAHVGSNGFSTYCVYDGTESAYVLAYNGSFNSSAAHDSNRKTRTWSDRGTLTFEIPWGGAHFRRTHDAPDKLFLKPAPPILGGEVVEQEYDLTRGRLFLFNNHGYVRQFDIATPVVIDQESAKQLAASIAAIPPRSLQPKAEQARLLYERWKAYARTNGDIPGALIGRLGAELNDPEDGKLTAIRATLDASRDWTATEVVALLEELAQSWSPRLAAAVASLAGDQARDDWPCQPLPAKLQNLPWGQPDAWIGWSNDTPARDGKTCGLRVACVPETPATSYPAGSIIPVRIYFHNAGNVAFFFNAGSRAFDQIDAKTARTADGRQIKIDWASRGFQEAKDGGMVRLAPGQWYSMEGGRLILGDGRYDEVAKQYGAVILPAPGDTVKMTWVVQTAGFSNSRYSEPRPDWKSIYQKRVRERVLLEAPLPASSADRAALVRRVRLALTGVPATEEEVNAFAGDTAADALEKLIVRLQALPPVEGIGGPIKCGELTFTVTPGPHDYRGASAATTGGGIYELSEGVHIKDYGPHANIDFILPGVDVKSGPGTFSTKVNEHKDGLINHALAWQHGKSELWIVERARTRRIDFSDVYHVKETAFPPGLESVPENLRETLAKVVAAAEAPARGASPALGDEAVEFPGLLARRTQTLKPETAAKLVWGPVVNGLRAAVVQLSPPEEVKEGGVLDHNFIVRNVSDKPVRLQTHPLLYIGNLIASRDGGEEIVSPGMSYDESKLEREDWTIAPGEVLVLPMTAINTAGERNSYRSGRQRLAPRIMPLSDAVARLRYEVNFTMGDDGFWKGKLVSGPFPLETAAANSPRGVTVNLPSPAPPAPAASPAPATPATPAAKSDSPRTVEKPVPVTVMKLNAGLEEKLQWGEAVNGLRAALVRPAALDEPAAHEVFDFKLVVQNVSGAPIHVSSTGATANTRYLKLRDSRGILSAHHDLEPPPVDFTLQPREVATMRLFKHSTAGDSISGNLGLTFVGEFKIEKAPAPAWSGRLVTADTAAIATGHGLLPKGEEAQMLFKRWSANARRNEQIPGAFIGLLADGITKFADMNPDWPTTPQLLKLRSRCDATRDWTGLDALALLDTIAAVQTTPVGMALEQETNRVIRTGKPLPQELAKAPWGEPWFNGLRLAWLFGSGADEYPRGTPLPARVLIHNSGKEAVVFLANTWNQPGHNATNANGAEIKSMALEYLTLSRLVTCRLGPGEYLEVDAPGIGVGPQKSIQAKEGVRVGTYFDVSEGDTLTVTTDPLPLYGEIGKTEPDPGTAELWWREFITDRLKRDLPLPADAKAREYILYHAAMDLFGTPVSAEIVASFTGDQSRSALETLAKRLASRPGLTPFAGSLQSGATTFKVTAPEPDASKKPRTAATVAPAPATAPPTAAAAVAPKQASAQQIFREWQSLARADGKIPGARIGELKKSVETFVKGNPTWPTTPKLVAKLPQLDATHDWEPAAAAQLLDEILTIQNIGGIGEEWRVERGIRTGSPLPPELAGAPWADAPPTGLRVAWMVGPGAVEYRLGTPLKSRILVHNAGKQTIVFRSHTWHQSSGHAHDAKGTEIPVTGISWMTIPPLVMFRLAPGEYIELTAPGIGVGKDSNKSEWADVRVGTIIEAKEGDEVTFTPGLIPLVAQEGEDSLDGEPRWWRDFILARLNRELPLPADAAERQLLLDRAVRDLFGTAPTAEETAAFVADKTPTALDSLAERLASRPDVFSYAGSLASADTKFRVLAADPDAGKRPRVVLGPGDYPLSEKARLFIVGRGVNGRRTNDAVIRFSESPEETIPRADYKLSVPDGYGTWAIVCRPGTGVFWIMSPGAVRKVDYSDPVQVKETPATRRGPDDMPEEFRAEAKRILELLDVPAKDITALVAANGANAAPPAAGETRFVTRGTLRPFPKMEFPGGVTIAIDERVFHGGDVLTTAQIRWPARDGQPTAGHDESIAGDAFGNREQWACGWVPGTKTFWYVNTGLDGQTLNFRRVVFSDPQRITTDYQHLYAGEPLNGLGLPASLREQFEKFCGITEPVVKDKSGGLPEISGQFIHASKPVGVGGALPPQVVKKLSSRKWRVHFQDGDTGNPAPGVRMKLTVYTADGSHRSDMTRLVYGNEILEKSLNSDQYGSVTIVDEKLTAREPVRYFGNVPAEVNAEEKHTNSDEPFIVKVWPRTKEAASPAPPAAEKTADVPSAGLARENDRGLVFTDVPGVHPHDQWSGEFQALAKTAAASRGLKEWKPDDLVSWGPEEEGLRSGMLVPVRVTLGQSIPTRLVIRNVSSETKSLRLCTSLNVLEPTVRSADGKSAVKVKKVLLLGTDAITPVTLKPGEQYEFAGPPVKFGMDLDLDQKPLTPSWPVCGVDTGEGRLLVKFTLPNVPGPETGAVAVTIVRAPGEQ